MVKKLEKNPSIKQQKQQQKKQTEIPKITLSDVFRSTQWVEIEEYLNVAMKNNMDNKYYPTYLKELKAAYWEAYNTVPVPLAPEIYGTDKKPTIAIALQKAGDITSYFVGFEIGENTDFTNVNLEIENWLWLEMSMIVMNMPLNVIAAVMLDYLTENDGNHGDEDEEEYE
jgi:hypothetical protein